MDETTKAAVDERLEWIKSVTKLGLEHGPIAIRDAIQDQGDEAVRSLLYVLMIHYQGEAKRLSDAMLAEHDWNAAA
jgi:hypothetical protein